MVKENYSLVTSLQNIFPEDTWTWSIPPLKRESLVWDSLQEEHFRDRVHKELGTQPQKWSPARLAVIAVNLDLPVSLHWPLSSFNEIDPEVRQRVFKKYQAFTDEGATVSNLADALLIALGLQQEKEAGKTWEELLSEPLPISNWRGPLVCLYELLDSPSALLNTLPDSFGYHIALARPGSPAATRERLRGHLTLFPRPKQLTWLNLLREELPELASQLAKTLTSNGRQQPSTIADMISDAQLFRAADDPHRALKSLQQASTLHDMLKGKLSAQINAAHASVESPDLSSRSWQDLIETVRDPGRLSAQAQGINHLIQVLIEKKFFAAAQSLVEEMREPFPDHPGLLSSLAAYALSQDQTEKAQQTALGALALCDENHPAPAQLCELLFDLGLFEEAIQAAESTLAAFPTHEKTLSVLSQAQHKVGDHPRAVDHAQLAVLSSPDDLDLRRNYATYLEHDQKWDAALQERSLVLAKLQREMGAKSTFEPVLPEGDLHALANCAYYAGQPGRAVKACENLLQKDPDDGLAHATLGKSLRILGDEEAGFEHLEQATQKAPQLADAWLALSTGYREQGNSDQALHVLKMGASAAEERAKIYLAIGKLHLENRAQSQALEAFQKSSRVAQEEDIDGQTEHEIGYQLGKSYYQLGHLKEARNTLRELKERYPGNPETHYIYGQVLLEMDEPRGALPYLAQVVDSQPAEAEPYIDYADAHLRIGANPKIAIKTLDQALQKDPAHDKGKALLAEAFAANEEYDRALTQYKKSLDSELMTDPSWGPRITMGLGSTALQMGQTETALATLKEGFNSYPHHVPLAKTLAEGFAAADLRNDALSTARDVLDIAGDDMETLAWVADFALELDSAGDAIPALQEMTNLVPDRTSTYITLGKAHRKNGDPDNAREVFSKLSRLDNPTPEGLYQAGDELLELGDIEPGMNCLEKAAHICQTNSDAGPLLSRIWARLADGHAMNGNADQALDLLDQAIAEDLDEPLYRVKKAELLADGERYQAALASLKNALDLNPDQAALHHKAAHLQRQVGSLQAALNHAQQALELKKAQEASSEDDLIPFIQTAADLASASGQNELAYEILNEDKDILLSGMSSNLACAGDALCLLAELALEGRDSGQAESITETLSDAESRPDRVKALRARNRVRKGKLTQADNLLDELAQVSEADHDGLTINSAPACLGIARAFRDLNRWDEALDYYRRAASLAPRELRSQLALTQALVHRGEEFHFARAGKVINHSPGPAAIAPEARDEFRQALSALKEATDKSDIIRRWELRGEVVFKIGQETLHALEEFAQSPPDLAALLAALRRQHRMDQAAKRAIGNFADIGHDPRYDGQVALSILNINPGKAKQAAQSALSLNEERYNNFYPVYHIIQAFAAEKNQNRSAAHQAVIQALEVWEDEPRWHALAASFCPNPAQAVSHLERAVELEPSHADHYLALGQALNRNNEPLPAIEVLEESVSLQPDLVDGWISLSRSYRNLGQMEKAMACARQSVECSPQHTGARIIAAEIALLEGNHQEAERHLAILTERNPQNPQVLALLSETLAAQNRSQEAMQVLKKAIPLSRDPLSLKLQQAELIKEVDGTSAAVDALRVLGSQYPDQYQVVSALVKALAEGGETDQAISTAKTILSKDDVGHTPDQKAHLHLVTGRLLRQAGQLDQAVHHFNEAKKLDAGSHDPYLEMGKTHIERRQYDRALQRLNEAIDLAPDDAMSYFHAGKVLKELKEYDRAERMLRQASKLAPNDLRIHRQLGVLVTLNLVHGNRKKESALS